MSCVPGKLRFIIRNGPHNKSETEYILSVFLDADVNIDCKALSINVYAL